MNKYFFASLIFVVLGVLLIALSSYAVLSYATTLFQGLVDFVASGDYTKLQQCGIAPPSELEKLKNDFPTIILPALYWGLPLTLIILSVLMFLGGRFYERAKQQKMKEEEEKAKEAVKKVAEHSGNEVGPQDTEG